jgi:pimeloyl-ACP methyl ester carboxylesterase
LEIDRANLLGSSLAGYWLQTFGSRHHRRIKSLILASTFRESRDLRNHPQFSIPTLQVVDGEVLKADALRFRYARRYLLCAGATLVAK